jgi:hypothetical protein
MALVIEEQCDNKYNAVKALRVELCPSKLIDKELDESILLM